LTNVRIGCNSLSFASPTPNAISPVLEAEWAYLSRPERVMTLSDDLLQMEPIGQDRILPLDAIPMRIEFDQADLKKIVFDPAIQPPKKDQAE
jgi:hypothetical protein